MAISNTATAAGKLWTDTGKVHDERGLKHRSRDSVRVVPIPPVLVRMLVWHIETFGVAPDGRLFRSVNGGFLHPSTYNRVWSEAREYGLSEDDRNSPRLRRPYDLRPSGVSVRRTANVPARDVAEWAGHSVQVLEANYSRVLVGYDDRWEKQMDDFLAE